MLKTESWKTISLLACSTLALGAATSSGETFVVQLDGPSFVYEGMTDMDIALQINVGDTVRWEWVTGFHNVVSGIPGEPGEGTLFHSGDPTGDVGTIFEFTFDETGLYGYHCEIHESIGMVSTVSVVPAPASAALLVPVGLALASRRRRA
jgi:plastocyanin